MAFLSQTILVPVHLSVFMPNQVPSLFDTKLPISLRFPHYQIAIIDQNLRLIDEGP